MKKLIVTVPAYNEEEKIEAAVLALIAKKEEYKELKLLILKSKREAQIKGISV